MAKFLLCQNTCLGSKVEKFQLHPFLLPHEWLAKANLLVDLSEYAADENLQPAIWKHINCLCSEKGLNSPAADYTPLGLHCDGVPFGSQVFYQDSLELFTLNLPCGPTSGMKIPFTSCQKNNIVKHKTFNAILEVLAWSLKHLALGMWPVSRHDGADFGPGEMHRVRTAKSDCKPAKALLLEIRADWAALKQVFQFPQQNENAGMCWMCHATPADFRDCNLSAAWRHNRRKPVSCHLELKQTGKSCPLWSVPGVSSGIVIVDWLPFS